MPWHHLAQQHYDCGHFQVEQLPCRHVLACCTNQRLDWRQVYVHDVYKMSKICKVYRDEFVPIGDPSSWVRYEGAKVITNWTLKHAIKGRPKSTRYMNGWIRWICVVLAGVPCVDERDIAVADVLTVQV
ncbi:hypothetical protein AHAS_Ahas15G0268900 [Arachis hypogaea]